MVFLLQILPDFSGVQSGFDRDLVKVRSIFGVPLSCEKNGKMGKMSVFFWENGRVVQNIEKEFVQYDLLSEKVGTRIISLNAATIKRLHEQKQQQTSTESVLDICCFAIHISKKDLKILVKCVKIEMAYKKV